MINKTASKCITLALFGLALANLQAEAGEYCPPPPCGHYEVVVVTRYVEVPYIKHVTLYDNCGRPYQVERPAVRLVKIAERKRVFVRD